ncbi:hypothetical protein AHiyo1_41900 [Arthrobacter sp. Hiyo1]|nr:hypothetical protein AHiyo1_41900 [Arthrobacter sp. Hiyo1]
MRPAVRISPTKYMDWMMPPMVPRFLVCQHSVNIENERPKRPPMPMPASTRVRRKIS